MPGFQRSRVIGVCDEELDEFICGICLEVFVDPVVTQCCQQSYCSECIHNWLSDNNTCPNDRKELSREGIGPAPRLVYNLLNKMQVKCDFYAMGCESVVKMCELSQHIIYCDHNANRKCKSCELDVDGNGDHKCIESLLIMNKNFCEEIKILKADKQNLLLVVNMARVDLDNCEVKSQRMSATEVDVCVGSVQRSHQEV
ncbi:unnamed protein product [Oppiella nova]|uniref:RING-type domain-containing protein n=1 Tax=Oppiella nova TaxID=334625 RepID=A0A7R9LU87_9ACAR|nr:unnamed protein product [Oppiella nova]CAG2167058.1 unnamed protein product [Oppiella nova]